MLKIGNKGIASVRVGGRAVAKITIGDQTVWESGGPAPEPVIFTDGMIFKNSYRQTGSMPFTGSWGGWKTTETIAVIGSVSSGGAGALTEPYVHLEFKTPFLITNHSFKDGPYHSSTPLSATYSLTCAEEDGFYKYTVDGKLHYRTPGPGGYVCFVAYPAVKVPDSVMCVITFANMYFFKEGD